MQSLNDDERKEVLSEVLIDELKAIHEYVKELPAVQAIKDEVRQLHATVSEMSDRLTVIEHVVKRHSSEIKDLLQKTA